MYELLLLPVFIGTFILTIMLCVEGATREIGWAAALMLCLFATPITGAVCVALSKRKADIAYENFMTQTLAKINNKMHEQIQAAKEKELLLKN